MFKCTKSLFLLTIVSLWLIGCSESNQCKISCQLQEKYNKEIEIGYKQNASWLKTPLSIVAELTKAGQVAKETHISMFWFNSGDVPRKVKITIKEKGVLDDAKSQDTLIFHLEKVADKWRIVQCCSTT